ncbi:hypothetical protein [Anaerocolumna sp. MB42-C2]|uniref:hypothetical protein n=1 Tax=Anaerocolumna sp. MB42-C2 TaxID=3070997 RepID=UPI0027E1A232|nr:hypothetical protein [Anaerocolumna sp. MB42-C2]WMJ85470.1 hypothetical protein RBU59_15475 [Anaerocolumna sp. MB42-C2]
MPNKILSYTPELIKKAIGKQCVICDQYISEDEANKMDFEYSKTKSKHEIFIHKHCWSKTYKT